MKIAKRKTAITLVPEDRSRRRAIYDAVGAREKWSVLGYASAGLAIGHAQALASGEPVTIGDSWSGLVVMTVMAVASAIMWWRRGNDAHALLGEDEP